MIGSTFDAACAKAGGAITVRNGRGWAPPFGEIGMSSRSTTTGLFVES
jgi:hypothetical protein